MLGLLHLVHLSLIALQVDCSKVEIDDSAEERLAGRAIFSYGLHLPPGLENGKDHIFHQEDPQTKLIIKSHNLGYITVAYRMLKLINHSSFIVYCAN
ncbi:hypothetical protein N665_0369s0021 [Sinapis alba]|nr:hypothetical protein N665_0369s0021 [Sinapis alba]